MPNTNGRTRLKAGNAAEAREHADRQSPMHDAEYEVSNDLLWLKDQTGERVGQGRQ